MVSEFPKFVRSRTDKQSCKKSGFITLWTVVVLRQYPPHVIALNLMLVKNKNEYTHRLISSTNFNAQFSLFINNMFVTLLSSTCFEHQHAHLQEEKLYSHSIWYLRSL